jgi:hypothetical protein
MRAMAIKTPKIEFEDVMTVADMIEAAEDLRARFGPDAQVRVTCKVEFNPEGQRVTAVTAERK